MDVNFSPLPSLSSGSQGGSNSVPGGDTAVKTLQSNPASVVSQSNSPSGLGDGNGGGQTKQEQPDLKSAQQALDSLKFSSRRTQVGFNNELNKVFLEVVDTRTDQVVEQIPSEEFVRFVSEQLESPTQRADDDSNGAVIDQEF